MFYTYDLSFDRTSSLSFSKALSASSSGTSAAVPRKNGVLLTVGATNPQIISGIIASLNPFSPDFSIDFGSSRGPFASDFSADFGSPPVGIDGYVIVTVNKFIKVSAAQVSFLTEPPTHFHLNSQTAPAISSQIARLSTSHTGALLLAVLAGESLGLRVARPWHIIVAAQNPSTIRVIKAIVKVAFHTIDNEVSLVARALGHIVGTLSTQALQTLYRVTNKQHALSSQAAQVLSKVAGRIFSTASGQVALSRRSYGRALTWINAEVVLVARGQRWHVSVAAGGVPRLSFGGGNLFARAFGALSSEAVALQRGQAALRGLLESNAARIARAPGKVAASTDAEVSGLLKQPGSLHAAAHGQAVTSKRQSGLVRAVANASTLALRTAASHLGALSAAINAQVTALFTQRTVGRSLLLQRAQSGFVSVSSVRTLLRSISAGSPQAISLIRGMAKSTSVLSVEAAALVRSTGKLLAAGSASLSSVIFLGVHFFIAGTASPEVVAQRASHSALKGTTSPEVAAVARRRGAFISAVNANVANVRSRLAKLVGLVQQQIASLTNAISRALAVISQEIAVAIKGASKAPAAVSPESAASITRKGSNLGTISSIQVSALRRLTNKLLLALAPQVLSGGGRGGTKILRATSTNIAAMFRPRGVAVRTSQGQAAANAVYYHFFVAPWAYQQAALLPPAGGPAEPPSFGPIDPADQTIFAFDWTSRAYPNDRIMSAVVTCVPPYLPFLPGSLFISGNLVEITVPPFPEPVMPTVYSLRCTSTFASGRVSSFSIPVPVRTL